MKLLLQFLSVFPSLERILGRLSLRVQVAILLAVAMLPVGIFSIAQGMATYSEIKELRREAFTLGAVEASKEEEAAILEAFGALSALDSQLILDRKLEQCQKTLDDYRSLEPNVPFVGYIAIDGKMTCASSEEKKKPRDYSDEEDFRLFIASPRRSVTAKEDDEVSGQRVIIMSQPVYRTGELRGVLRMSISSRYLDWVARTETPDSRFAIVSASGIGIAQANRGNGFDWLPSASRLQKVLPESRRIRELQSREGHERVYAIVPLFKRDIFAIASWPDDNAPNWLSWRNILTISLPLLMWALAVGVAYFAVDQLALRHILYLDRLVTAYGRSGRPLRAQAMRNAPSEIAQLGQSFDKMAEEIETRENALVESVEEKDALLREVNHRVKNNLQMISSLMSLQIRDAHGQREKIELERLQERIEGLALVHRKIYESERTDAVRLDRLISDIAGNLHSGSAKTPSSVTLTTELDDVTAPPETAVPLVLFATEAIVNTFKHALSHVDDGWLDIVLKDDPDALRLTITNSLHLLKAAKTDAQERRGIGEQLIDGFARQLRGRVVRTETDREFKVELIIPREEPQAEVAAPA